MYPKGAVSGREIAAFGAAKRPAGCVAALAPHANLWAPHRAAHRAYPAGRFAAMK